MKEDVPTFTWQEEYGAFGVSKSQRQTAVDYICRQKRASSEVDYEQEFVTLVRKSGVEYDPQYLFG